MDFRSPPGNPDIVVAEPLIRFLPSKPTHSSASARARRGPVCKQLLRLLLLLGCIGGIFQGSEMPHVFFP